MRIKSTIAIVTIMVLLGVAVCAPPVFARSPSAPLSLDSWVYSALDKLNAMGLVDSALQGARPYSRAEAARQVEQALTSSSLEAGGPVAELAWRLEREFATELDELARGRAVSSYVKPVREIRGRYLYKDGLPSKIADKKNGVGKSLVDSSQFSLNTNNFGIDYSESSNVELVLEAEGRLGPLLLNWRPLLLWSDDAQGSDDTDLSTLQGVVVLGAGPFDVSIGRQSLWWGQGRHGALVLTNNAKPLDMLRITNPAPTLLPWVFKGLGPFRFDVFWSRLEEDRTHGEPYFAGLRFDFKPRPWLEIGASRTVMFGGEGIPDVDFSDFITILGGKNHESGEQDNSNNIAALDVKVRLAWLFGLELYGELGGEDEAGGFIANNAYLVGGYLPAIDASGRVSLRLEYADLSRIDDNSPVWYRHQTYLDGYTYEGKIMGHHVGGSGEDLYGEISILGPCNLSVTLALDLEKRGADQPVEEEHLQPSLTLEWSLLDNVDVVLNYALDRVENFGFAAGEDKTFHFAGAQIAGRW